MDGNFGGGVSGQRPALIKRGRLHVNSLGERMARYGGVVNNVAAPRFKVNVTAKHIKESMRRDSKRCMIDEATVDAYGRTGRRVASYAQSDLQTIRFTDVNRGVRFWYLTPRTVQEAILAFDAGRVVRPFSFWLAEAQVRRCGWKGQGNREADNRPGTVDPRQAGGPRKVPMPRREREFGLQQYTR